MIDRTDHELPQNEEEIVKEVWAKPEIVDYTPAVDARGISFRNGDGLSNLS